jgi:hypothetical protein
MNEHSSNKGKIKIKKKGVKKLKKIEMVLRANVIKGQLLIFLLLLLLRGAAPGGPAGRATRVRWQFQRSCSSDQSILSQPGGCLA